VQAGFIVLNTRASNRLTETTCHAESVWPAALFDNLSFDSLWPNSECSLCCSQDSSISSIKASLPRPASSLSLQILSCRKRRRACVCERFFCSL
jgi:hypothetical protein